jgi:hypothetical protein
MKKEEEEKIGNFLLSSPISQLGLLKKRFVSSGIYFEKKNY